MTNPREIAKSLYDIVRYMRPKEATDAIEQALLSYAAETERRLADLQSDYDNDRSALNACRAGKRALRKLFAAHGIPELADWPDWIAVVEKHLSRSSPSPSSPGET